MPPQTVRFRLTLLYGALFLASGAVLLAITYLLVRSATGDVVLVRSGDRQTRVRLAHGTAPAAPSVAIPQAARQAQAQAVHQHAVELHQLLVQSGIALAIMAFVSVLLGWLVAGRVLRPLRTMTASARRISEHNLHERLAIAGPRDELRDLADTIDELLAQLEGAFGAQRRFVANAAHELRTPLTLLHALLEEQLTDPDANLDSFRSMSRRLLSLGQEQERLLEALLTLASSERGLDHHEPFDLSMIVDHLLLASRPEVNRLGLKLSAGIAPAPAVGDPALAERLVANLIDNAIRYNVPGGQVLVHTGTRGASAYISVANTGAGVDAEQLERVFEPFQRLNTERTNKSPDHHGLGLSIVRAIAAAHHATVTAHARPDGGLVIEVRFPATAPAHGDDGRRTRQIRRRRTGEPDADATPATTHFG